LGLIPQNFIVNRLNWLWRDEFFWKFTAPEKDIEDRIDAIHEGLWPSSFPLNIFGHENRNPQRASMACRARTATEDGGNDLLFAMRDPYYCKDVMNPKHFGRDYVGDYDLYAGMSRDWSKIYVVLGTEAKRILGIVEKEWLDSGCEFNPDQFDSKIIPGCQLRRFRDKWKGQLKVCAFLQPEVFVSGTIWVCEVPKNIVSSYDSRVVKPVREKLKEEEIKCYQFSLPWTKPG
jgi:hypothetical protein